MLRVFIFAGQSNSQGYASRASLPFASTTSGVSYARPTLANFPMLYQSCNDGTPTDLWGPFQGATTQSSPVYGEESTFGPELACLRKIQDAFPDWELAAIKYASGGTAITQWIPGGGAVWNGYEQMIEEATARLDADPGPGNWEWSGLFWAQGETGALDVYKQIIEPAMGDAYMTDTRTSFAAVRALTRADLPIVIARLFDFFSSAETAALQPEFGTYTAEQYAAAANRRREQQEDVASDANNTIADMDNLVQRALDANDYPHVSDASYLSMGEQFWEAWRAEFAPLRRFSIGSLRLQTGVA